MHTSGQDYTNRIALPCGPLTAAIEAEGGVHASRALGVDKRTYYRWQTQGVPLYAADAACRVGLHPSDIWGQAWWDACAEQSAREDALHEGRLERRRTRRLKVAS